MRKIKNLSFLSDDKLKNLIFEYSRYARSRSNRCIFGQQKKNEAAPSNLPNRQYQYQLKFDPKQLNEAECKIIDNEINLLEEIINLLDNRTDAKSNNHSKFDYLNFIFWYHKEIHSALEDLKIYNRYPHKLNELTQRWVQLHKDHLNNDNKRKDIINLWSELPRTVRAALRFKERRLSITETAIDRIGNIVFHAHRDYLVVWTEPHLQKIKQCHHDLQQMVGGINVRDKETKEKLNQFKIKLEEIGEKLNVVEFRIQFDEKLDHIQRRLLSSYLRARDNEKSEDLLEQAVYLSKDVLNKLQQQLFSEKTLQIDMFTDITKTEKSITYQYGNKILEIYHNHPYLSIGACIILGTIGISALAGITLVPGVGLAANAIIATGLSITAATAIGIPTYASGLAVGAKSYCKRIDSNKQKIKLSKQEIGNLNKCIVDANSLLNEKQEKLSTIKNHLLKINTEKSEKFLEASKLEMAFIQQKKEELDLRHKQSELSDEVNTALSAEEQEIEKLKKVLEKKELSLQIKKSRQQQHITQSSLQVCEQKLKILEQQEKNYYQELNTINAQIIQAVGGAVHSVAHYNKNYDNQVLKELQTLNQLRQRCVRKSLKTNSELLRISDKFSTKINSITKSIKLIQNSGDTDARNKLAQQLNELSNLVPQYSLSNALPSTQNQLFRHNGIVSIYAQPKSILALLNQDLEEVLGESINTALLITQSNKLIKISLADSNCEAGIEILYIIQQCLNKALNTSNLFQNAAINDNVLIINSTNSATAASLLHLLKSSILQSKPNYQQAVNASSN